MLTDLDLALLSKAAYPGPKLHILESFNIIIQFYDVETDTEAFLAIDDKRKLAVLSFRGTEKEGKDIKTDIRFFKKNYQGCRIHKGFLKAYLSVKDDIDFETSALPSDYNLYITGHSLGGALACLATLFGDINPKKLVTFGQPRIGNKSTAKELDGINYTRYVNHADAVARMPKINYYQGGHLIYLNEDGKAIENPSSWYMFKDRITSFFHRYEDHSIDEYIRRGIIK